MMDKNWMWLSNRLSKEFRNGVKSFIKISEKNLDQDGKHMVSLLRLFEYPTI